MAKIMVVDDEETVLELVKTVLEQDEHEIIFAHNGNECLEMLEEVKPDLVLLDIMMPEIDGKAVCRRIRANPQTKSLRIAFLSTIRRDEAEDKAIKKLNVLGSIAKPFESDSLRENVKKMLREGSAQK